MFLPERLTHWAQTTPDSCAIYFEGQEISFAKLEKLSAQAASNLHYNYGVKHGDRVAYLGLNHPNLIALFFGCMRLGAIFTPLNSRLALAEFVVLLADAEPSVCFYDEHFEQLAEKLNSEECNLVFAKNVFVKNETHSLPERSLIPNDPALLVYTSGTTGNPKGVILSHKALECNVDNNQALYDFSPGQKILITLPLFHVGGLCILLLPALCHGASIYLHARFDPGTALADIEAHAITSTIFVPAQMSAMMTLPNWNETDLSSLKYVVVGSSIIPLEQIQKFHGRGIPVSQVYGATETGPTVIALQIKDAMTHEGSAGTIAKNCAAQIRTPDNLPCKIDQAGEIWVSGDNILSGYWCNDIETKEVLIDGWYNTGDVGYFDESGYYWIVDRVKDVIISGGENIYPAEVEAVSAQHKAIAAIAVVGKPHDKWGETPVAMIELHTGADLSETQYLDFLQDRLARYKQPRSVIFMEKLPRNVMGKIEKPTLRKMLIEN